MNLDNLLAYQKADMVCRKIERELNGESRKKMVQAKADFEKAKANSEKAEGHATKIDNLYKQALQEEAKISKRIEEIASNLDSCNKDEAIAELKSLKSALEEIEKKINTYKIESEKAVKVYSSAISLGTKARKEYESAKEEYKKIESKYKADYEKYKKERDELRGKVDEQLLAQYDALIAQNVPKPFVEVSGTDKNMACGGCSLTLSHKLIDELKEHGFCHCDSCRRIVYKR